MQDSSHLPATPTGVFGRLSERSCVVVHPSWTMHPSGVYGKILIRGASASSADDWEGRTARAAWHGTHKIPVTFRPPPTGVCRGTCLPPAVRSGYRPGDRVWVCIRRGSGAQQDPQAGGIIVKCRRPRRADSISHAWHDTLGRALCLQALACGIVHPSFTMHPKKRGHQDRAHSRILKRGYNVQVPTTEKGGQHLACVA